MYRLSTSGVGTRTKAGSGNTSMKSYWPRKPEKMSGTERLSKLSMLPIRRHLVHESGFTLAMIAQQQPQPGVVYV